ncbi:MAG: phospholipase D-like domain-containing protein [Gemmatimonadota bacterium]|nr:phospholipase D-like domain-containing protein [Gemmatimonadota bacterium]
MAARFRTTLFTESMHEPVLPTEDRAEHGPGRRRKHRTPQYVDGPALRYALWRRIKGRVLLLSLTLGTVGLLFLAPKWISFPHAALVMASIPLLTMALAGLPHLLRDPVVRTVAVTAASVRHREPGDPLLPPCVAADAFRETFALVVGVGFSRDNHVDVLTNGDGTYEVLWSDLRAAQRSITVQMYYAGSGRVADTTIEILAARARAGLDVYFLYDAFGTADLPRQYLETLRLSGVHTAPFRPIRWYALDNASHRLHVRGVVVDGRIGFTGGFGLDDKWLGDGRQPGQWRDTNVRFSGAVVESLQAGFVAAWSTATGEVLAGDFLRCTTALPGTQASQPRGVGSGSADAVVAAFVRSPPLMGSTAAERLLALAIASASRTLYISNAYFVPTLGFARLLVEAAQRGVDVRILTNGRQSDVRTTWLAGRRSYEPLLRAGVRIYEYSTTIHAKTFVVDGHLAAISTMNFDNRSLAYNNEVALVTLDETIGNYMASLFLQDAQYADEILLAAFQTRAWTSRLLERMASIGSRLL